MNSDKVHRFCHLKWNLKKLKIQIPISTKNEKYFDVMKFMEEMNSEKIFILQSSSKNLLIFGDEFVY